MARTSIRREDSNHIRCSQNNVISTISTLELTPSILGIQNGTPRADLQRFSIAYLVQWAGADIDHLNNRRSLDNEAREAPPLETHHGDSNRRSKRSDGWSEAETVKRGHPPRSYHAASIWLQGRHRHTD
ncbi:hypothetical protein C4D60_Mb03t01760 [Musa balbisiana]|uniref:Uncharacterized protein n=1 Tax=Musa balbisiana TaxID=52838 RepID=A0A4S8J6X9_MUSBA|nr:hypothetical protein C4D60_Mb03t01760 [Musa balbisiana]